MDIAILAYDQMTALDAVGPYEILSRLPEARLRFVAPNAGTVRTDTGFLGIAADAALSAVDSADVLLVPGGPGSDGLEHDEDVLAWIARIHEGTTWTTSVCTGSLILGAAGVLKGLPATTHWTRLERLREHGAEPTSDRVVEAGKVVTAAGVSAGIDMALRLAAKIVGDDFAQMLQLGIEYDPQPPFDAGSPAKAPAHVVELVRAAMATTAT